MKTSIKSYIALIALIVLSIIMIKRLSKEAQLEHEQKVEKIEMRI